MGFWSCWCAVSVCVGGGGGGGGGGGWGLSRHCSTSRHHWNNG